MKDRLAIATQSSAAVCVAARCASSRASGLPRSSRGSLPISLRARPAESTTHAHRRCVRPQRNSRPPHHWPLPDCVHRRAAATLRLTSCPRPTAHLAGSHHCRFHQIASHRPRIVRARTDNEPDNDRTNTPPTTQIGRLFFLSFAHRPDHPLSRQVHRVVPAVVRPAIAGTRWPDIAWRTTPRPSPNPRRLVCRFRAGMAEPRNSNGPVTD